MFKEKENYASAVAEFSEAIRLNPNFAFTYYLRSGAYRKLGQNDKAQADLATARQLDNVQPPLTTPTPTSTRTPTPTPTSTPTSSTEGDAKSYYDRGNAYDSKGNYDEAITDYTEAIRLEPNKALYYNGRGSAYYHKMDYPNATADWAKADQLERK